MNSPETAWEPPQGNWIAPRHKAGLEAATLTLQTVLATINDGVFVLDGFGEATFSNHRGAAMLNLVLAGKNRLTLREYITQLSIDEQELCAGDRLQLCLAVSQNMQVIWIVLTIIPRCDDLGIADGHIALFSETSKPNKHPSHLLR